MKTGNRYVFDACALLAIIYKEAGTDVVRSIIRLADKGEATIYMNKLNLYEAYYDVTRSKGLEQADKFYDGIMGSSIQVIDGIADSTFRKGAYLKSKYRMSLADSIALGEAFTMGASILTADHHELDIVEQNEDIQFTWFR